jgi:ribosomal-protein-alanine N-acetyltransferase
MTALTATDTLRDGPVALAPFGCEQVTDEYVAWLNDPETMRFTEARFARHSRESAQAYVRAANDSAEARLWRILYESHHVGNIRLSDIDLHHRHARIALLIGRPEMRGRGLGRRAISLACAYAFGPLALHKLTAGMYADNIASYRAFLGVGFVEEARLRRHFLFEGRFVDAILMSRWAAESEA